MTAHRSHRRASVEGILFWVSLAGLVGTALAWLLQARRGHVQGWLETLALIFALTSVIVRLAGEVPAEKAALAALTLAFLLAAVLIVNAKSGIPFGARHYVGDFNPPWLGLFPWPLPLLWTVILLASRDAARLILRAWPHRPNPGLWTLGLTALLVLLTDLSLEPFAVKAARFWTWRTPTPLPAWYGAPWFNFPAWAVLALLLLAFVTPWLLNKRPVKANISAFSLLLPWLTLNLFLVLANAAHGLRAAVILGVLANLAVTLFALRVALNKPRM